MCSGDRDVASRGLPRVSRSVCSISKSAWPGGGLSFPRFAVCMFPAQPVPLGRRGVLRGCIEEAGLLHRARVFAQISPLTGPRVGLCYPSYTMYTSRCFPAPGRQVRGGQGAGWGVGVAVAPTQTEEEGCTGCPGKPVDFHPVSPSACNGVALCCFRVAIGIPTGGSNSEMLLPLDRQIEK